MNTPTLLHIETSTHICSVALSQHGKCLFQRINTEGMNHAALLSTFIAEAMKELETIGSRLDAVAVSAGPGSYTGLRIGVATAKGLCYGLEIPMIAVSTLEVLCQSALQKQVIEDNALLCPMIDARRMEVYAAFYTPNLNLKREISADIIDEISYQSQLENGLVYFFGNGADKCKTVLTHPNARFMDDLHPLAVNMITLAEKAFSQQQFVDLAYYEPFYLKEFQATVAKSKVLP